MTRATRVAPVWQMGTGTRRYACLAFRKAGQERYSAQHVIAESFICSDSPEIEPGNDISSFRRRVSGCCRLSSRCQMLTLGFGFHSEWKGKESCKDIMEYSLICNTSLIYATQVLLM
jgi:hypothetical protein